MASGKPVAVQLIQSGSVCVQFARAKVRLYAPGTAIKIRAMRTSPVRRAMTTGTPSPAYSANSR
jgi:hypothetical protein